MAKQSISIDLDAQTLRGLAAFGDPAVVLAGLASAAAARGRPHYSPQRDETDVSLRLERHKADDREASWHGAAEVEADAVLQVARDRADEVVQNARDEADSERGPRSTAFPNGSTQERARALADVEVGLARTTADAMLGYERVEQRRASADARGAFREATDTSLTGERDDADSMIVDLREANSKMVSATLRAHDLAIEAEEAKGRAEASERELRAVAEFREMFIGILAHDLRNPLNTMVMASGLLIAHGRLDEPDARLVNRIANSGHRMARMIAQVVDFARARLGGGFNLVRAPSDLGTLCRDIAEEIRIGSSAVIDQTSTGDVQGTWDVDRLAQALSNLVGNAVSHATAHTPVMIHSFGDDAAVVVEVTNHGVAIRDEVLPFLFGAYHRGPTGAASDSDHLGLGLYIASEIVRAHGGTLAAGSKGGLTTFTMRLPRGTMPPAEWSAPGLPRLVG